MADRHFWSTPWQLHQGAVICITIFFIGLMLELVSPFDLLPAVRTPLNLFLGAILLLTIVLSRLLLNTSTILKWFSGTYAAICFSVLFLLLICIMGFIPQSGAKAPHSISWLYRVRASWPFLLSVLVLLYSLGLVTLKRLTPINRRNIGFFLNHAGLFILVFAMTFGSGDREEYELTAHKQDYVWYGRDLAGRQHDLPLAIKLREFSVNYYLPKALLIDNKNGEGHYLRGRTLPFYNSNTEFNLADWEIKILTNLRYSGSFAGTFKPVRQPGEVPAAYVSARNSESGETRQGWVSCGSFLFPPQALKLDKSFSLGMLQPAPRLFRSMIEIITKNGTRTLAEIEVNKPFSLFSWDIYQLSYDEKMGTYSPTSTFQVVRDPWLTPVYIGVFLLLFGALYLLIFARRIRS